MRKSSHVQYDLQYHIVWATKYRYRVLTGKIAERTRELIRQSCNSMDVSILKGSIGKEHIHILMDLFLFYQITEWDYLNNKQKDLQKMHNHLQHFHKNPH